MFLWFFWKNLQVAEKCFILIFSPHPKRYHQFQTLCGWSIYLHLDTFGYGLKCKLNRPYIECLKNRSGLKKKNTCNTLMLPLFPKLRSPPKKEKIQTFPQISEKKTCCHIKFSPQATQPTNSALNKPWKNSQPSPISTPPPMAWPKEIHFTFLVSFQRSKWDQKVHPRGEICQEQLEADMRLTVGRRGGLALAAKMGGSCKGWEI